MKKILVAALIATYGIGAATNSVEASTSAPVADAQVLDFAKGLPLDFADAIFGTPLAARIEIDGQYFADALIILDRNGHIQLSELLEQQDSPLQSIDERRRYESALRAGFTLGACSGQNCPKDIVKSVYSASDSKLALFTERGSPSAAQARYYALPEKGTGGLLVTNRLSAVQALGNAAASSGAYTMALSSNIGDWTAYSDLQVTQNGGPGNQRQLNEYLNNAYLQREFKNRYVRAGYFVPDNSADQGNLAPVPFASYDTIVGAAVGSSDTLLRRTKRASLVPLTVSASKPGYVEIYQDERLLATQSVQPGLSTLDTENLPDGIYDVDIRLTEDGRVTSRQRERVYKPSNWNGEDRSRYSVYGGRRVAILDSNPNPAAGDDWVIGAQAGYLFTPKLRGGMTVVRDGVDIPVGLFAAYDITDWMELYANPYYAQERGYGFEVQTVLRAPMGSVVLNTRQAERKVAAPILRNARLPLDANALLAYRTRYSSGYSSITGALQIDERNRVSMRTGYDHELHQTAVDLSYYRDFRLLGGTAAQGFVNLYQRPAGVIDGAPRMSRGFMLGATIALGRNPSHSLNVSFGAQKGGARGTDQSLNADYRTIFEDSFVNAAGITGSYAKSGSSATANAQFGNRVLAGDVYAQQNLSGYGSAVGVNLDSTVAVAKGGVALTSSEATLQPRAGMIIDVASDDDSKDDAIVARINDGSTVKLHPGSNFVQVDPYESHNITFDYDKQATAGAKFSPPTASAQLFPGGVGYQKVQVMRTVAVIGRLIGANKQPMRGARVANHASFAYPEADGVFTLELSKATPTVDVLDGDKKLCSINLGKQIAKASAESALVLGDVSCE
ncbi:hypothetical protein AWB67_04456 [Caballeronia terrestris]|uniref:Fimbrial biogenesis outer membrane usher protein n=1 Tax=Caballeronia terrestris TaxID=1226301 RepID=A0A158JYW4_9BURK|nr:TcfC E-set like domain-containing protein [Caballeronia terrestris]SAL73521.1 hypothetical protein AWB67_04456 [Caballeronia terrestris]